MLFAPLWIFRNDAVIAPAPEATASAPPLGAYRLVSKEVAKARWLEGVPEDKQADLIPPGVFEAWVEATWATDPDAVEAQSADAARAQRRDRRRAGDLDRRQGPLRSRQDHRADTS